MRGIIRKDLRDGFDSIRGDTILQKALPLARMLSLISKMIQAKKDGLMRDAFKSMYKIALGEVMITRTMIALARATKGKMFESFMRWKALPNTRRDAKAKGVSRLASILNSIYTRTLAKSFYMFL